METDLHTRHLEFADDYYTEALNELNRPAEDVVPFMVCQSARKSVSHYLMGFLLEHGGVFKAGESLEDLLEKCLELDPEFENLDLSMFEFGKDFEYSAGFKRMNRCMKQAYHTRELVL